MSESGPRVIDCFILTAEPAVRGGTTYMVIYASAAVGPVRITAKFSPYFFVSADALPDSEQPTHSTLSGVPVLKKSFHTVSEAETAAAAFRSQGRPVFETDVRPRERFLMDQFLNAGIRIEGTATLVNGVLHFDQPIISPSKYQPNFKVCSLDIETSITDQTLLSIAVHHCQGISRNGQVFMIGDSAKSEPNLTFVDDEPALLSTFLDWFRTADPDILIGWNVIGFDLVFLRDRAQKMGIPLNLGREDRSFSISQPSGRFNRVYMPGRIVLDGPQLLRGSFHTFESYSLDFVSKSVLGDGKLIASNDSKAYEIERLFKKDKAALARYNLRDTELVTEIFERLELLELTIRRSQLSGMLLDQVGMSIASLDHFLLPRIHEAGFAVRDVADVEDVTSSSGGYVMTPKAGIYDDVVGLDFQSLYPTIIRTFFIDPLSLACRDVDSVTTPSGHRYSRSRNILPAFIASLMSERRAAKESRNRPLSQAIKILMNSFYGVMGTPGSRMYHRDLPDAITGTGQWILLQSKAFLETKGCTVIYGDTDSLFVKPNPSDGTAQKQSAKLAEALTEHWKVRLREEFTVESHLAVDCKAYYRKFLVPSARNGKGGAKKRYAGLIVEDGSERLEFVGLEVVRSDWTLLAQEFQSELYSRIFHGTELRTWLRELVRDLKNGKFDEKLVYRKRLHKKPSEYGTSPPPYVRAAQQLSKPGRTVRYIVTKKGPVPVELNPKEPDYDHYIARQLRPVADAALELLGTSFDDLVTSQQLSMF